MKNRSIRFYVFVAASVLLTAIAGCGGDGTVRGAGSIEVPRPGKLVFPTKGAAPRSKTASIPSPLR